jgi:hypothetical protein
MSMNRPLPQRFRRRLVRMVRDLEQTIRDIESWNENRTDAEPIDCGCDRVMLAKARQTLAAFDRGDWDEHARLAGELAETAQRVYLNPETDDA